MAGWFRSWSMSFNMKICFLAINRTEAAYFASVTKLRTKNYLRTQYRNYWFIWLRFFVEFIGVTYDWMVPNLSSDMIISIFMFWKGSRRFKTCSLKQFWYIYIAYTYIYSRSLTMIWSTSSIRRFSLVFQIRSFPHTIIKKLYYIGHVMTTATYMNDKLSIFNDTIINMYNIHAHIRTVTL